MNLYDVVVRAGYPLRWWARLEVHGGDLVPAHGPVIVVANHDSMIDPLAVAAACHPRRFVRFLAMSELWNNPLLRVVLDGIGQIPTDRRGGGEAAISHAVKALGNGEAIGIFPEGGLSKGRKLRARRGLSRLAAACPDVPLIPAVVTGTGDIARFPKRPRACVTFLPPDLDPAADGHAGDIGQRLLDQIRAVAPPMAAGRTGRLATRMRQRRQRTQERAKA
jgi:1-acyl-sn-glycerol-3-phosphate acyltransferase